MGAFVAFLFFLPDVVSEEEEVVAPEVSVLVSGTVGVACPAVVVTGAVGVAAQLLWLLEQLVLLAQLLWLLKH